MKKFIAPLLALGAGAYLIYQGEHVVGGALIGVAAFLFGKARKPKETEYAPALDLTGFSEEQRQLADELFQKAVADYNELERLRDDLKDPQLGTQLAAMQQSAYRLLKYLEEHPLKTPSARRFTTYYQDRAVALTRQYIELEKTGLKTAQVEETKGRVRETLLSFDEAYEAEFEKLLTEQLMDMDAETSVIKQNIKAEGLADRGRTEIPEQAAEEKAAPQGPPVNAGGRGSMPRRTHVSAAAEVAARYGTLPEEIREVAVKHKIVNGLLAICLGSFGAHKFYQGKTKTGVLYAVLFWTMLPGLVGLVEGIRYLVMPTRDYYESYLDKEK